MIDLTGKSDIADYMVIASGQSSRQVATMADKLVEVAKKNGVKGVTPEGRAQADWVLFDAGDVIIHLFRPEVGNSTTSKRCGMPISRTRRNQPTFGRVSDVKLTVCAVGRLKSGPNAIFWKNTVAVSPGR